MGRIGPVDCRSPRAWCNRARLMLCLALYLALCLAAAPVSAQVNADASWAALRQGAVVVFRHASAPGGGDPPGLQLSDCSTQRNLDEAGREQARRMGQRLRQERIRVGAAWASQWCRTQETAELMNVAPTRAVAAFNSFFADRQTAPAQTAAARALLLDWRGPGALVVVTHQVNISALTGVVPASGEGVVLRRVGAELEVVGQVLP